MRKIILLALTTLMGGCISSEEEQRIYGDYTICIIDSCEYIHNYTYMGHEVHTHKGNCRFCKERREKELEELVTKLNGK